jgi:hypothetical protein
VTSKDSYIYRTKLRERCFRKKKCWHIVVNSIQLWKVFFTSIHINLARKINHMCYSRWKKNVDLAYTILFINQNIYSQWKKAFWHRKIHLRNEVTKEMRSRRKMLTYRRQFNSTLKSLSEWWFWDNQKEEHFSKT